MAETIQTRTSDTCAVRGCERTHRAAITAKAQWVKLRGLVYASERRCFVVHSWADSCTEHTEAVATAVAGDIEEWAERWNVEANTSDYETNEPVRVIVTARGTGTPKEWALF